jgi:site-specific DNA-cytosine methylase
MNKFILELCSGFGGPTEYFLEHNRHTLEEQWVVVRIENNPLLAHVEHTAILDVENWREWLPPLIEAHGFPHVIWASPPCREFSLGYSAPQAIAARLKEEYQPNMRILRACLEIIEFCNPQWFIVENVHGSKKWFEGEGLKLKQTIGSFQLYGNFPTLDIRDFKHSKYDGDKWSSDPLRANHRAKVPIEISHALFKSLDQVKLTDF